MLVRVTILVLDLGVCPGPQQGAQHPQPVRSPPRLAGQVQSGPPPTVPDF